VTTLDEAIQEARRTAGLVEAATSAVERLHQVVGEVEDLEKVVRAGLREALGGATALHDQVNEILYELQRVRGDLDAPHPEDLAGGGDGDTMTDTGGGCGD
jgi:hypothetical protein